MSTAAQRKHGGSSSHIARRLQPRSWILTPDSSLFLESFPTALGWVALARREDSLVGLVFGHTSAAKAQAALNRQLRPSGALRIAPDDSELADQLRRFAEGEPVDFSHVEIDDEQLPPFAKRVVAACRRIPWGQTRSYGQLAAECGSPAAARAVGQAMAKNRFPLVVPCHRVLASGGRIGGLSAPQGLRMKRRLLMLEGVDFSLTRETSRA